MQKIIFLLCLVYLGACNSPQPELPPAKEESFTDPSQEVQLDIGSAPQLIPQRVSSPPLPRVLTFAGDTIPLNREDVREGLENELLVNTFRHSRTLAIIKSLNRWRPLIERTLVEYQVPADFLYLAVAESEFDNTATSYAGAVGMWQFMEETGLELGLEVNRDVDMRRDPLLATQAASNYLTKAYESFGNWTLVAASYNRGIRGIRNALDEQEVDSYFDLHLNNETARYLYRILAFKLILENPEAYGYFIDPDEYYRPYHFTIDSVEQDIDNLVRYAKKHQTTYKELRILNPWLNNTSSYRLNVPSEGYYAIRIPQVTADSLLSSR